MIVEMKKISFLVFYKEYLGFLERIRNEGVLHIESMAEGMPADQSLVEKMKLLERVQVAIKTLTALKLEAIEQENRLSPFELLESFEILPKQTEEINIRIQQIKKELNQLEPWGEFSWENIDNLARSGKKISFFSCSKSAFKHEWIDLFDAIIIKSSNTTVYFITVTVKDISREIEAELQKLPRTEIHLIQHELQHLNQELNEIKTKYEILAKEGLPLLRDYQNMIYNEFSMEKVVLESERQADDRLMILEGWIPCDKEHSLKVMLENEGVYYDIRTVEKEDNPPVMLKNNWFSRLFEPIGKLYALPNYREIDLTPFFAPFYWIFFGFCVGDAGYGLLLSIVGTIVAFKGSKNIAPYMKLVALLGVSTFIMGLVSGTFFGISLYDKGFWFYADLNEMLKAKGKSINDMMFSLALALGGIQILFGMAMKAANEVRQQGFKYSIGTISWLLLILGLIGCFAMKSVGVEASTVSTIQYVIMGSCGVGIFFFNSPENSIFSNVGSGLWGAYNMATGLLGDLLSYIRLFALGVSGGILGYVFNLLSSQLSGNMPGLSLIIMLIILLIGHGINIFMGSLGGFVHSMRLTFVEFYKNSNFAGGGHAYKPFIKK
jgi:V/A-type H+-transporting ATPase subunit I